jgi:amidohydrolase
MASSDRFRITILGKGGHGAIPHKARNPINAATDIVTSLQELSAYEIDAMQPNVITVCSLHAGDAPNIIPEQAQLEGSVRTYDEKVREEVKKRIQEIAILSSKKFRNQCCVAFTGSTPPLINNEGLINLITSSLTKTNLNIIPFPRMMISDDFAQYSQRVPAAYLAIGAGGNEPQYKNGVLHDPKVIFNENALCSGAIALSVCSFSFCNGAFG